MKNRKPSCTILKDLSSELDSFRSSSQFSARIPQPLRESILRAIDDGIEPNAYLDNPMISISNDFSERMLRMEKLIQANALFRKSLEGRFALDIMCTIFQTATAAKAPLAEYFVFVLRADNAKIKANLENYIPFAYAKSEITNLIKSWLYQEFHSLSFGAIPFASQGGIPSLQVFKTCL